MFGVALRKRRDDASATQTLPDHTRGRPTPNRDEGGGVRVVPVRKGWRQRVRGLAASRYGGGELNSLWNSLTIANQMALAAELGPVIWIRPRQAPPKTARIELPSMTARDQSIICP